MSVDVAEHRSLLCENEELFAQRERLVLDIARLKGWSVEQTRNYYGIGET